MKIIRKLLEKIYYAYVFILITVIFEHLYFTG